MLVRSIDYGPSMSNGRRGQLIDSGIELVLSQRWQDLLGAVDTRSITDRAGVTTGSFFHHFRNRAHYAEAVVDRFVELWDEASAESVALVEAVALDVGPEAIRAAADGDWSVMNETTVMGNLEHLLWVARTQPLSDDTTVTAGEVLAARYQKLTAALLPVYERARVAMGREMLPPFTSVDLAVLLTALGVGLEMRIAIEPDVVRDHLYGDAVTALVIAMTRPRTETAEPEAAELATLESQLRRPVTPGPVTAASDASWRRIADAAAPLFLDRKPDDVRVAEIAAAAEVSPSTVYHQFGSVTAVAAAVFAGFMPELQAISAQPLTADEGPVRRIEQVLTRYVELAQQHRSATEALVTMVVSEAGAPSDRPGVRSIRAVVALPDLLLPHVRELRARGLLRRRVDSHRLSRSFIHLVTMQTLMFTEDPVERIVDETIALLLDGALAGSGPA